MAAQEQLPKSIRKPLALTWAGLWAERVTHAFWPVWSVLFVFAGLMMFGLFGPLPFWGLALTVGLFGLAVAVYLVRGLRSFHMPSREDALRRLDATLPGRPIAALRDRPAVGNGDPASEALWHAHLLRMAERVQAAKAVGPALSQTKRDPYALRYVAIVAAAMGLLFGSFGQMGALSDGTGSGAAQAAGPSWEGWVEPPAHTRQPALYLNDLAAGPLDLMQGSRVIVRLYGGEGLTLSETVSGDAPEQLLTAADAPVRTREFSVAQSGTLEITGDGGRAWTVALRPDAVPTVSQNGEVEATPEGEMSLPFYAEDDYGIVGGSAEIRLDLASVDRRYGLALEPEPRDGLRSDLPLSYSGSRQAFGEILREDFSKHPWANLPVHVVLRVEDAIGQVGHSDVLAFELPGRRFFDPVARAVIEARRDLMWNRENASRIGQVMRAVTYRPEDVFRNMERYEGLKAILARLETAGTSMDAETRDALAEELWAYALELEDGDLEDARERMRQAQERLTEAMRNGASPEEIERLMQELRDATRDFMQELAERNGDQMDDDAQSNSENTMELTQNDLQEMMDRIQELMNEGRMAEAQQMLDQLMQMMENMSVQQGQGGQGQQAMDDLGNTLREQQELSDDAFDQLNQGQQGQEGQQQGQGQQGQGQQGDQAQNGQGQGQGLADQLAQRQRSLRNELERQRRNLPGAGTEDGDAARRNLDDAGRSMDEAEDALRDNDLGEAIDRQADAIESMREGLRSLEQALEGQEQGQDQAGGQQGQGRPMGEGRQDPLGRREGNGAPMGTEDPMLNGEDVYRRAEELTEEIRRRSAETERPEEERDYLNRLLDRF
ncbi:TIGR02302 family protein [Donghicola sp. XS_ASV15]|uniref:TIGR02302 family protein n=1 Tax=Donghicola sp. XS_ASV15 TaxID=3241295 RepID=UPI003513AED4